MLDRLLKFGTEAYPETVARRLRQVNGFNVAICFLYGLFAAFYALADWSALKPLVLASLAMIPLLVLTPFLHRINDAAGVIYIAIVNGVAFIVFSLIVGSAAGLHYFLFAAPGASVFFGPRWIKVATLLTTAFLAAFLYVELVLPPYTSLAPISPALATMIKVASVTGVTAMVFGCVYFALRQVEAAEAALAVEYSRSESLLENLMPQSIAARLKQHPEDIIADQFDEVTILFADIVGFTPRSDRLAPSEVVRFLNRVFSEFDSLVEKYGLEKIKTIGDAYMVAGGMPERRDGHAAAMAEMALDMIAVTEQLGPELHDDLAVRIGIHTGPAVAGVIGTRRLFYDVWGDTVNTASRMESQGVAGKIQITANAKAALGPGFTFERRGAVEVKGKGEMELFYLTGRRPA